MTRMHLWFDRQVVDCLADGMAFGALEPCKECQGQLVFKGDAYYCTGDISAWTKCVFKTPTPVRKDWVTPKVGHLISRLPLVLYLVGFSVLKHEVVDRNRTSIQRQRKMTHLKYSGFIILGIP